jgi:integrase
VLKELDCKNAKSREKAYKKADGHGLYLHVLPSGTRSWRWNYRYGGKEGTIVLGRYPELSLAQARLERAALDKIRREGSDPRLGKHRIKNAQADAEAATFKAVALRWHAKRTHRWTDTTAANAKKGLEREIFPFIGDRPISEIKAPEVLAALQPIEDRGAVDRAHRARQHISAVFKFAIASGLADHDPAAHLKNALRPKKNGQHPAVRSIEDARALLLAADAEPGHPSTKLASRLLAVTAVRSGPLRHAEPHEFKLDCEEPVWIIPAGKMKLDVDQKQQDAFEFIVPLPPQAVEIIKLAMSLTNGKYVFPNARSANKPMSENAISTMYRRLPKFAHRHVPHGWRSTFSTIMNERASDQDRAGDRALIELMLAHKPGGVEAAYNRANFRAARRRIAGEWADLLLGPLPPPETLIEGRRR